MSQPKYYPPLSDIVSLNDIPDILSFLKDGIATLFDKVYYKNLQYSKSPKGDAAFYSLDIVSFKRLSIELPGTGIFIILNPSQQDFEISSFPITVKWEWKVLGYLQLFNLENFSFSISDFFSLGIAVFDVDEISSLNIALQSFVIPQNNNTRLEQFVIDVNSLYSSNISGDTVEDVINQINEQLEIPASLVVLSLYILSEEGFDEQKRRMDFFFSLYVPEDVEGYLKDIIIPESRATLALSAGIEFPRNMLVPVYPEGTIIGGEDVSYRPIPEPAKALFTFAEALFYADTTQGIGYNMDLVINTVTPVQLGQTGIILNIHNLKIDLSTKTNFPEADADGHPPEFMGVYTEQADIILPKNWFSKDEDATQTLKISGKRLLIGTGGISGIIALEAVDTGNPPAENDYFWVKLGSNPDKSWKLGFNKFDIRFNQGTVAESNIRALLTIPKFKKVDGNPDVSFEAELQGHLSENGDFSLTASFLQGLKASLFNFVTFNFLTLELGRENDNFYLGTSCQIWFENEIMKKLIGNQIIEIPKLRVYSNGNIEIVGGDGFLPVNISLNLGPVKMAVTGLNYGSTELQYQGKMRRYNYWGFNGAISINPLGVDVRGDGIKYY